ncbi:terpenoid synthase [Gymnopilus junonius]|uniref:Terpene synthase n=1 Tax=Gymnopilus junonius TaxID=109634 RepID=A0A9P5NJ56_GYMJU|nr:terpenoid synthase [Gymnopilus junonius]
MTQETLVYHLPDTLKEWPWPRRINRHHEEAKAESDAWFRSFKAFSVESQKAFDRCDFTQLRTACDMTNLFFVFDEYTDSAATHLARHYADVVIDALRNPFKKRPDGEVVLGAIAQEFWARGIQTASANSQRLVHQAQYRDLHVVPSIETYLQIRRQTIGVYPSFAMIELPYDLPAYVVNHPVVQDLARLSRDLIILDNDILSYNKEQASEEIPHNLITVVMYYEQCNLYQAIIPTWDPSVADMANDYLEGIANWVRSNNAWHFESGRYFGDKSKEIEKSR